MIDTQKALSTVQRADALEERVRHLAAVVESSDDAIIGKSMEGIITSWNRGAQRLYEYTEEEVVGKPVSILMPPNRKDDFKKIMGMLKEGKIVEHYETERKTKSGKILSVSLTVSPIRNAKGVIVGASKIARDITQRKRTEKNLQFLADASKILSSSLDYQSTLANVARLAVPTFADWCSVHIQIGEELKHLAITHTDKKKEEWARSLNKKYPPRTDQENGISRVMKTGKPELYESISDEMMRKFAHSDDELKLIQKFNLHSVIITPLLVQGKAIGVVSFVLDDGGRQYTKNDLALALEVTSRMALAVENSRLYSESQRAVGVRDEFISVASHELKTPLTSLKMYTQALQRQFAESSDTKVQHSLKKIDQQVDKLTSLVANLLNVSKVQHGKLDLEYSLFDMQDLIEEAIEAMLAQTHRHQFTIEGKAPTSVQGDRDRIYQVLTNLLTNAVKYSPNTDHIIVRMNQTPTTVSVEVQDFGIGIEKEYQGRIFEQFFRVNDHEEKTYPGLGVGLYIAKDIVSRHQGTFELESKKGKGSTFRFTLPM